MTDPAAHTAITRRHLLRRAAEGVGVLALSSPLISCIARSGPPAAGADSPATTASPSATGASAPAAALSADEARLVRWTSALRADGLVPPTTSVGRAATRVGELAVGTPYVAFALESYLREGGSPTGVEPLALSLSHFDCVSLVESCVAIARLAATPGDPTWDRFGREIERLRYRDGIRSDYSSRLHYFSEWIRDNASRGGVHDISQDLGGVPDRRPLRFMSEHRSSYPALADDDVFAEIAARERGFDLYPRWVVPTARIPVISDRIQSGDILAFATAIEGLDVTHTALAYRDAAGVLRVLHAPLSGGAVEVTRSTLHEYVAAIRRSTGILVARPLPG